MTDETNANDAQAHGQEAPEPSPALRALDRLVGTWELSGDTGGRVTYEWMEGGFFLIQRANLLQEDGTESTGMEVIGHERGLGAEPSADVKSRFYSDTGDTLDYLRAQRGPPDDLVRGQGPARLLRGHPERGRQHAQGRLALPGGGGYKAISTRVG